VDGPQHRAHSRGRYASRQNPPEPPPSAEQKPACAPVLPESAPQRVWRGSARKPERTSEPASPGSGLEPVRRQEPGFEPDPRPGQASAGRSEPESA
jgi:hypothetical protein